MAIMRNPAYKPNTRAERTRQLLDVVRPTTDWEYKLLEGHAHSLLNLAAAEMNLKRVHDLLDAGVRVVATENEADSENGWTVLHHLIQGDGLHGDGSNNDLLEKLLQRKAVKDAIDHCNDNGETALYLAIQVPMLDDACLTLIRHGAALDGSRKALYGEQAGEEKKQEWQFLIDRPWDKPRTVAAYLQLKSTDALQAAFLLNSLHTAGISKHPSTLGHLGDAIEWVKVGIRGFAEDPDQGQRKETARTQLESTALSMLRWATLGDLTIPKDVWLAERAPLMNDLLEVFQAAGCQMWAPHSPERPEMRTTAFLQALNLPELAAELERTHLNKSTQHVPHSRSGARL